MGGQTVETLNYSVLADFYDRLVKDDNATREWVNYTKKRVHGTSVLELACGSGEITLALTQAGYHLTALDLSQEMIDRAKMKEAKNEVDFKQGNMLELDAYAMYDGIVCYCDSINYLNSTDLITFFREVYAHLNEKGSFLFDMHTEERLLEFIEPYIEEDWIDETAYQWAIESDERRIIHHFRFYFKNGSVVSETHIQNVFELTEVLHQLEEAGFSVEVTTDFEADRNITGEKYFIWAKKGEIR